MKKSILLLTGLVLLTCSAIAQKNYLQESKADKVKRMQWWTDDTFGMFIHWGLYAVPAGEYNGKGGGAEWIMETHKIPTAEYEKFAGQFNPQKFNAKEWVQIAKSAGAKYIVITSKHHDGFSMWDSEVTGYDIMDATPFKRDILKELSDACKAAGIKFCLYHSILDWHQPDAKSKDYLRQAIEHPDFNKYRETYLKPQLAELIRKYNPEVLWFDGEWIPEWSEQQGKDLYNYLRNIKPSLIINNRVSKARGGMEGMNKYENAAGDFGTPEQEILKGASQDYWESCMTLNGNWGYVKNDNNWKSAQLLIDNLVDIAAKGGNYLLNVGPTAEGQIPAQSIERLAEMGKWLAINKEAIYATNGIANYKEGDHIKFTQSKDGKSTYALFNKYENNELLLTSVQPKTGSKIYMLGVNKPLSWTKNGDAITIKLPEQLPGKYTWTLKIQH
ncbi:alpha-L-fucosidase [Pedobacter psychroterrae]|uniref:alpha-L-fucosidase n=1 Tax=Pedobacter psychroterrae TaxID=2530453 RepID=A0A4R0NFL6_9SPHI|nr:alpha-L-fucosidase [Pedobacter psychroterrae]TCC97444.1 alpha-L-fucosidase [Pedobacter psychroterrae]